MSIKAIVDLYIQTIRPKKRPELDCFRNQPSLQLAIERAALAVNCEGKRYSHQRRLTKESLKKAQEILLSRVEVIENARNFDELFGLVNGFLESVHGLGELYIYHD